MAAAAPTARAIACSRCGGSLTLRAARAETVVCPYCHAQLDLTSGDYAFLAQLQRRPDDLALQAGLTGRVEGVDYVVAGFVRWNDAEAESSCLDDWFLQGDAGRTGWLRFDGYSWRLCHVLHPIDAEPVDLQELDPQSQWINFDGGHHLVLERSRGTVAHLEGELLWKARQGEAVTRLRCDPDVSVEVGPTRVRYFRWQPIAWENVAEAFGVPDEAAKPVRYDVQPAAPKPEVPSVEEGKDDSFNWVWVAWPALGALALLLAILALHDFVAGPEPAATQVQLQRPPSSHAIHR